MTKIIRDKITDAMITNLVLLNRLGHVGHVTL